MPVRIVPSRDVSRETLRVTKHHAAISEGLARYPTKLLEIIPVAFWTDDPIWTGLHDHTDTGDGRSYADTAHAVYPEHSVLDRPMIVLPERPGDETVPELTRVVVHEVAHLLDWQLGQRHDLPALNFYAETNRQEAFAESVVAWLMPDFDDSGWLDSVPLRGEVRAFFETLNQP